MPFVEVFTPEGAISKEARAEIAESLVAKAELDPTRMEREPVAWVHINEIPEGDWGAMGRVVRFPDIAAYVLEGSVG